MFFVDSKGKVACAAPVFPLLGEGNDFLSDVCHAAGQKVNVGKSLLSIVADVTEHLYTRQSQHAC